MPIYSSPWIDKTLVYQGNRRKLKAAASSVARARLILGKRVALAPARTGGFYGSYTKRGRAELKVIDVAATAITVTPAASLTLLNGCSAGTDYLNRIGRKIIMKSILIRGTINPASGASRPIGDIVRAMVFWDLQANSVAPVLGDILQSTADVNSPMNLTNRDRFKIVQDKFIVMNPDTYTTGAPTGGNPITRNYKLYKKCNQEVIFSGTGFTVGNIQTGSLFMLVISQGTSLTTYTLTSRVRFEDM